jgi:transposase
MTKRSTPVSPEVRERAVRMRLDHQGEHGSPYAAIRSIASKIGATFGDIRLAALIFLNVPIAATGGILAPSVRGMPFSARLHRRLSTIVALGMWSSPDALQPSPASKRSPEIRVRTRMARRRHSDPDRAGPRSDRRTTSRSGAAQRAPDGGGAVQGSRPAPWPVRGRSPVRRSLRFDSLCRCAPGRGQHTSPAMREGWPDRRSVWLPTLSGLRFAQYRPDLPGRDGQCRILHAAVRVAARE